MRLLHVASSYPLVEGGTTAPFMEEMLGEVASIGHDVRVIVPRIAGLQEGMRRGVDVVGYRHAPVRYQNWGYGRSLGEGGRLRGSALAAAPVAMFAAAASLRRHVRAWSPDVVHLHWLIPHGALATIVPRDLPVVISVHGADARFSVGWLKPIARRALSRADIVIAASSAILEGVAEADPPSRPKMRVIAHGADDGLFGRVTRFEARRVLGLHPDEQFVLTIGRLVPKKGLDTLISACATADLAGTQVYIGGSGPEEVRLRSLAQSLGVNVRFLGQLNRREVATWLAAADVVAIPSVAAGRDVDSGPVVLMEALASGTPVVSTPIGMAPDVIVPGYNGALAEPGNPQSLGAALRQVLALSTEMGANARATFGQTGSWHRVAEDLTNVYLSLARSRPDL